MFKINVRGEMSHYHYYSPVSLFCSKGVFKKGQLFKTGHPSRTEDKC